MTYLGTLLGNRKGLPNAFKEVKNRPNGDYMVLFEENGRKSIHSWITTTKSGIRNVMLITSLVPILGKTKDDNQERPALIKAYNYMMLGQGSKFILYIACIFPKFPIIL
jgi:hypothetical protein